MTLSDLGDLASITIAVIALIGVYPLFRQLRQTERNVRFQVYRNIITMLEDSQTVRDALERIVSEDPNFDVLKLSEEEKAPFHELVRSWDKVAVLVKYGVVPLEFVLDFYSRPIVKSWIYLGPLVQELRIRRNQPGHRSKFQMLAVRAAQYRRKRYPSERTFDVTEEDLRKWKEWRW